MDGFKRFFATTSFAWMIVVLLATAVVAMATGVLKIPNGEGSVPDYVAASQALASGDRAQAPHMRLEGQYPGPLQDTAIERWRDPVDGTICYVYLPIAVAHSPGPGGLVQYGAANIGSISCLRHK